MAFHSRNTALAAAIAAAILFAGVLAYSPLGPAGWSQSGLGPVGTTAKPQGPPSSPAGGSAGGPPAVNLTDSPLGLVKVQPASARAFPIQQQSAPSHTL